MRKSTLKLKHKVVLLITLVTVIPLLGFNTIFIFNQKRDLEDALLSQVSSLVISEAATLTEAVEDAEKNLHSLSNFSDLSSRFEEIALNKMDEAPEIDSIAYLDANGRELVRIPEAPLSDWSENPFFQSAKNLPKNEVQISDVDFSSDPEGLLHFITPLRSESNQSFQGALILTQKVPTLLKLLEIPEKGQLTVMDQQGNLLFGPAIERDENFSSLDHQSLHDAMSQEFKGWQKAHFYGEDDGRYWVIFYAAPEAELMEVMKIAEGKSYFILFLVAVYSMFLATFLGESLTWPIEEITKLADKYKRGDLGGSVHRRLLNRKDELGLLAKALVEMAESLKKTRDELEEKVKQRTRDLAKSLKDIESKNSDLEKTKTAMLNILEDIEEEKNVNKLLAQDMEKFKLAIESTSDQVVITDPEGIVIFMNSATERITGYSKREILGKKAGTKENWGGLMDEKFYKKLWQTLKVDKKNFTGEIKNRRKNGEIYTTKASISPILDQKGRVDFFVGIERDISKEKQIDQVKTEFVSMASHQLKTPITAINWYLEVLQDGSLGKLNKKQIEYITGLQQSNHRMNALVNDLLNISRLELGTLPVKPENVHLDQILKSVLSEQKAKLTERKLKLKAILAKDFPKLKADPNLMTMIFQNLVSNAIKYSPPGKSITVSLKYAKAKETMHLVVSDKGVGIPKDQQSKIFSKLFRANNAVKMETDGTGLGLYIISEITKRMHGKIRFKSEENVGSTFYVDLPMKEAGKKS